jgi:hypothetical protein
MNWRLKSALRRTALALPQGERLYRWLTAGVLGTNAGMAYKWFRVFPTHVRVLQEQFSSEARGQRLWCFDSGATMAAGLAMAVVTDEPGLLTDRRGRLSDRYCRVSRRVLAEKGPALAEVSNALPDRVGKLLQATEGLDARAALAAAGMSYAESHAAADEADWQGKVGCIITAGMLEHYEPAALEAESARMARALHPGGVMSHVVDHRDHRWHADKRIGPLAHLALDEQTYQQRFGNPLEYHNRWLQSLYVELFERQGFEVACHTVIPYTPGLPPLDRASLAPPFADAGDEDLANLVTHFVAVKHG